MTTKKGLSCLIILTLALAKITSGQNDTLPGVSASDTTKLEARIIGNFPQAQYRLREDGTTIITPVNEWADGFIIEEWHFDTSLMILSPADSFAKDSVPPIEYDSITGKYTLYHPHINAFREDSIRWGIKDSLYQAEIAAKDTLNDILQQNIYTLRHKMGLYEELNSNLYRVNNNLEKKVTNLETAQVDLVKNFEDSEDKYKKLEARHQRNLKIQKVGLFTVGGAGVVIALIELAKKYIFKSD